MTTLAFEGVSVVSMDREQVLDGQTVVVDGEHQVRSGLHAAAQVEHDLGVTLTSVVLISQLTSSRKTWISGPRRRG
jgi:hypothetical protein